MNRRHSIRAFVLAIASAICVCCAAKAQTEPAASGTSSTLDYDLSYSQTASFYSAYGYQQRGIASGELEYSNGKLHRPLSLTYSGGYLFGISGYESESGLFQHLKLSQGYSERKWSVNVSDDVSYSPETPTTGFSGIPGVGTLPELPDTSPGTIVYSRTLYNVTDGTFTRSLNYDTSIGVDANYTILRYPTGAALETNDISLRPQISWRLNGLNSISLQYSFSRFSYVASPFILETQSLQPGYSRIWSRRLSTGVSAGPERTSSNNDLFLPPSTGVAASAWAKYSSKPVAAAVQYSREASTGAGYGTELGIHSDDATANVSHPFGRNVTIGASGSYVRTKGLLQPGVTTEKYGGVNAARQVGEFISISASYTALEQSSSLTLPTSALNGLDQVIGFSIAYHPRESHIFRK